MTLGAAAVLESPLPAEPFGPAEWSVYACPDTHCALARECDELVSPQTERRFKIRDGMPQFLRYDPAEDALTTERLQRLNSIARKDGWLRALETVFPEYVRYVTDGRRASYLDLLPLSPSSRVLEIGPGLGQHTAELARRTRAVHALEVVSGQAAFASFRCEQQGISNVFVACGGDDCRLPYRQASFDVVVCNLVLEWCASRETRGTQQEAQRRLLAETERVLRPGGALFLATKNRYALSLLFGRRDEHAYGMRFGNALPRSLMRLVLRLKGKREPAGLLHSYRGLRRMLIQAGFGHMQSFWAIPDMRYPKAYVPNHAGSVRDARVQGILRDDDTRCGRILNLLPTTLVKYFTPGLVFLAHKPGIETPAQLHRVVPGP